MSSRTDPHVERARQIADALDARDTETTLHEQFVAEFKAWQAEDPNARSMKAFSRAIGRAPNYTSRIVQGVTAGTRAAQWGSGSNKRTEVAAKALRNPEQRRAVIDDLSERERAELVEAVEDHEQRERVAERKVRETPKARELGAYFWRMMTKFTTYVQDVKWIGGELAGLDPAQVERVRERHIELRDACTANLERLDALEHGGNDVIEGSVTPIRGELVS